MKLVVFADYGLDDACATVYLLTHRDRFDSIDIVPIGGNVEADRAMTNAGKLLAAAADEGISLRGVSLVDTTACEQPFCRLPSVHGRDGMGDLLKDCASPVAVVPYESLARTLDCDYEILSLGPCTMVERTLLSAPKKQCGDIIIMGGCNLAEPNYNGYEFNDGLDHEAFVKTLARPHKAATLDTCRADEFNYINEKRTGGKLLDRLINRSVELASARHNDRCYIYDYIAALALVHPERFGVREVNFADGVVMRELYLLYNGIA